MKDVQNNRKGLGTLAVAAAMVFLAYYVISLIGFWGAFAAFPAAGILLLIIGFRMLYGKRDFFSALPRPFRIILLIGASAFILSFAIIEGIIIFSPADQCNDAADYLIILGAGIRGEELSLSLKSRLDKGLEYINRNPDASIVVTGGLGRHAAITEAEAMKRYLVSKGVPGDKIIAEEKATSTYENFKYSKELLKKSGSSGEIRAAVVTNEFHMFRAKLIARHLGFKVCGIPADTPFFMRPNFYVREYFAVVKTLLVDLPRARA